MRPDDPNYEYLLLIADALGDLRDNVVFVGGCTAGLLLTDSAVEGIRPTKDVDAIVEAATLRQYYELESRLPALGFVRDADSEVICRWRHAATGVLFDLMPIDPAILGFSNRWYPEAARTATRERLNDRVEIRRIAAPAFIATKLEADLSAQLLTLKKEALSADPQQNLAEHVSDGESLMGLVRLGKRESRRYRDFKLARFDYLVEARKSRFLRSHDCVVSYNRNSLVRLGRGLNSAGISDVTSGAQCVNTALKSIAGRKREHGIRTLWREIVCGRRDVAVMALDGRIGTQAAHEGDTVVTRCRCQNHGAAQFCELNGQRADRAAGAVDDEPLARLHAQHFVDTAERGQAARGERTRCVKADSLG